ncbi:hypothetical protein [Lysobacter gummosus]|uniref:hypothetical protein n=1 Tax=Lysobacter gummosus TaxID=262324 RepID=UPI00363F2FA4
MAIQSTVVTRISKSLVWIVAEGERWSNRRRAQASSAKNSWKRCRPGASCGVGQV